MAQRLEGRQLSGESPRRDARHKNVRKLLIAGTEVTRRQVEWLAEQVEEPTASVLRAALESGQAVVDLDIHDRIRIVARLEDPRDGLTELRERLLRDLDGYRRIGLI